MTPGRHSAPVTDGEEAHPHGAFRFVRGNPTEEEIAAVSAVIASAVAEARESGLANGEQAPSEWTRSQRPIRHTLTPGPGRWRNFTA
ncbi:acyl-CoA carboxylase subunit epsilon [Paramicrobacterium chengjingii]|uniref:Acyl-CoA carboxylase subunit epsilon n=1 Tax=Paramicrobacterium chengjingii TaxID=2769067 RepID=A0ABX6YN07_9MICO|nr:acyl-CoA carboxylase subunit epsilon [Microbacterium chengjingii]QPZ40192.1 acyl-CoA carboxylase subunit epsilon [Microbacterium chengjingii]